MGGGDLNMKKSWHPVLLVNQERVWKAEKAANEEKKKLAQLRKEQEEERQLAELQRLQEQATGKKRVDRMDWMYSAPSNEGGALGGAKINQSQMEDYLLGKRRVDEVLTREDKNVGNADKDFIAVQNANTARDTAAKIREDPLLAIKRQEQEAMKALANRPDIRRQLRAAAKEKSESKEERKARRKAEKEERRRERHERRHRHERRDRDEYSPRSDYSDDYRDRRRRGDDRRYRGKSRSSSPRRDHVKREREDYRDHSSRRYRDDERSREPRDGSRDRRRDPEDYGRRRQERRASPTYSPRREGEAARSDPRPNGHTNGYANENSYRHTNGHTALDSHPSHTIRQHPSRPSALDMADQPTSSRQNGSMAADKPAQSLDDMRAARLAAMSSSANELETQRDRSLAERAEADKREIERDERMRNKFGKDAANAGFFNAQGNMSLGESMQRRGGRGLQRDRDL